MADVTPDAQTPETPAEQQAPEESATETLGDAGKKALDAERKEKRAAERRAAELESRLKEFEDRDKTEAQKLAERADTAEERARKAEDALNRLEVALEKGLTPSQAKRLVGTTREEYEADADELLKDIGAQQKQGARVPAEGRAPNPAKGSKGEAFAEFAEEFFTR